MIKVKIYMCFIMSFLLTVGVGCMKQYTKGEKILEYGKVQKRERVEDGVRILEVKQDRVVERNFYHTPMYTESVSVTRGGIVAVLLTPVAVAHSGVLYVADSFYGTERMTVEGDWEFAEYVEEPEPTQKTDDVEPIVDEPIIEAKEEVRKEVREEVREEVKEEAREEAKTTKEEAKTVAWNLNVDQGTVKKWLFSGDMLTKSQFQQIMKLSTTDSILDLLEENPDSKTSMQLLYFKTGNHSKALAILAVQLAHKYKLKIDRVLVSEHLPVITLNNQTISSSFTSYEEYVERMYENGKNIEKR